MPRGIKEKEIEEVNGKEVIFKKNVDFFELKDGIFYTIDALCKKYDCQHTHIYRRAKEFEITGDYIMGIRVMKDDSRFAKLPKGNNNTHNLVKTTNYGQLHHAVVENIKLVNELNAKVDLILEYLTADKQQPIQPEENNNED